MTETEAVGSTADVAATVAALGDRSEVLTTPCGDGDLVWRRWGEGPPLVLVHGGSGSWTHWFRTIPELSRTHSVFAVDLPGLGASAMPDKPYTAEHCGAILAAGVRELMGSGERPQFTSFSFGAHVTSFALIELGDFAKRFVIVGCAALGLPYHGLKFLKEEADMSAGEIDQVYRTNLERLMFADPANIDDLAVHLQKDNVRQARFRSRRLASTAEIRENLPRIKAPLAAIWGSRDATALPSPEARIAILRERQPDLPAVIIDGAGHWAMYEAADRFNAALAGILSS